MEILLDKLYRKNLHVDRFHDRKVTIDNLNTQINGITQSGKTALCKHYLLSLKKNSYIYIDCSDIRVEVKELNKYLPQFCLDNNIQTVVFDNYRVDINFLNVSQIIVTCELHVEIEKFKDIYLFTLDYEEFLAYEHKYDSSALNHFIKLGGLPAIHKTPIDIRELYLQKSLIYSLDSVEFEIIKFCSKMNSLKLSPFAIYERLKQSMKISKDRLYNSFHILQKKNYIHQLSKYKHLRAIKKIYICDISFTYALNSEKHFGRVFESMIFLELFKSNIECYYDDDIDFYLPNNDEIIISLAFGGDGALFKRIEKIEAFIFNFGIKKITAVTMSRESFISHPFAQVEMIPFDIWVLGD